MLAAVAVSWQADLATNGRRLLHWLVQSQVNWSNELFVCQDKNLPEDESLCLVWIKPEPRALNSKHRIQLSALIWIFPKYFALWRLKREGKESAWASWEGFPTSWPLHRSVVFYCHAFHLPCFNYQSQERRGFSWKTKHFFSIDTYLFMQSSSRLWSRWLWLTLRSETLQS